MAAIKIVTDSAADLLPEVVQKYGISVVPLSIRFGETEFLDGVELSNADFWSKLALASALPSTAAPSPGAFAEAFRAAATDDDTTVICINLSSKLSGTYQSAVLGSREVQDQIDVRVIDSEMCAIAQAALVIEAAELAQAGKSADEIVTTIEDMRRRSYLFAALDTLDNLRKGGRIGAAGAFFGSLLAVKPIVTLKDGEVQADSRQRTRGRALEYLVKRLTDHKPVSRVYVAHSQAVDVTKFLELLEPQVPDENIAVYNVGPVVGTHTGRGLIAVSFVAD